MAEVQTKDAGKFEEQLKASFALMCDTNYKHQKLGKSLPLANKAKNGSRKE